MQSEIPEDVMKAAKKCAGEWNLIDAIARAIMAERERCKAALSAAEPIRWMWEERRFAESDIWDDMYDDEPPAPHKYVRNVRPLYAAPLARSVSVRSLQWDDDGGNLKARMGDREWMLNITSDGKTWAGSTRPFVFGRNITWSSVPNCSMVSLEAAKAACQADCQSRYAAISAQVQDVAGLDERMKAAGMYTIAEMMGVTPLTKFTSNPAINTIEAFSEWLDRKTAEYLRMKAAYELGDKSQDDELYEWVLAHSGVFSTIRDQFRVVIAAPAKQEGGHD